MNVIELSQDERFVECWHNGVVIRHIPTKGHLHDTVSEAREYLRKWTGEEPILSKNLKRRLDAIDSLITKLAYGKD